MYMIFAMKYSLHYIRRFNIVVFYYQFFSGNVLDNCDGRVISNNIYVDFGVIKNQCSCSFTFAFNALLFYSLSLNPGYDNCGTAIQISEITGNKYRMPMRQFLRRWFFRNQLKQSLFVVILKHAVMQDTAYEFCLTVCIFKHNSYITYF